jgi:hypothetical protein
MADEKKKPKIDLKARLGKTVAASGGGAGVPVPAPMPSPAGSAPPPPMDGSGSVPPPAPISVRPSGPPGIAPPPGLTPGLSPGIPLPPFGPAPRKKKAEPKQSGAQQTIKVEVGEEVEAERKRMRKFTVIIAAATAVVGGILGFVAGGQRERGLQGQLTVDRAGLLEQDVKKANDKMVELGGLLETADEQIRNKQYPKELGGQLAALNVPFDAAYLDGKGVGGYPGTVLKLVFSYTSGVEDLNKKKESLQGLLTFAEKPVTESWEDAEKPKFKMGVAFQGGGEKFRAELLPIKKENYWDASAAKWPEEFTVLKREFVNGEQKTTEKKAELWTKGDLTGGEKVKIIPADPKAVASFTGDDTAIRLRKAILDVRALLEGDKSDPTNETTGLLKDGEKLAAELNKIKLVQ